MSCLSCLSLCMVRCCSKKLWIPSNNMSSPFLQIPSKGFFSKDGVLRMAALEHAKTLQSDSQAETVAWMLHDVWCKAFPSTVGRAHNKFWLWRAHWFSISVMYLLFAIHHRLALLSNHCKASNSMHSQSAECRFEGITWILLYKSWLWFALATTAITQMATKTWLNKAPVTVSLNREALKLQNSKVHSHRRWCRWRGCDCHRGAATSKHAGWMSTPKTMATAGEGMHYNAR